MKPFNRALALTVASTLICNLTLPAIAMAEAEGLNAYELGLDNGGRPPGVPAPAPLAAPVRLVPGTQSISSVLASAPAPAAQSIPTAPAGTLTMDQLAADPVCRPYIALSNEDLQSKLSYVENHKGWTAGGGAAAGAVLGALFGGFVGFLFGGAVGGLLGWFKPWQSDSDKATAQAENDHEASCIKQLLAKNTNYSSPNGAGIAVSQLETKAPAPVVIAAPLNTQQQFSAPATVPPAATDAGRPTAPASADGLSAI